MLFLIATLEYDLVGAIPTDTGIPVHLSTRRLILNPC